MSTEGCYEEQSHKTGWNKRVRGLVGANVSRGPEAEACAELKEYLWCPVIAHYVGVSAVFHFSLLR